MQVSASGGAALYALRLAMRQPRQLLALIPRQEPIGQPTLSPTTPEQQNSTGKGALIDVVV